MSLSCAFFGHRNYYYGPYEDVIRERIVDLIENRDVTTFYNGGRGDFDRICAGIVWDLKREYPYVKNILVLSYYPDKDFKLDEYYDESVYLLEKKVPLKFAISHTNRKLVQSVDYVISGVTRIFGGAKSACDYAEYVGKTVFYVVKGLTVNDCYRVFKELEEKMKDEEYRKQCEEATARSYEATKQVEEKIAQLAKKRTRKNK